MIVCELYTQQNGQKKIQKGRTKSIMGEKEKKGERDRVRETDTKRGREEIEEHRRDRM